MTALTSSFSHTIRTLRLRAGLSQEELAERAGVSARAVSDMERGLRKSPRPETLRLLADALVLEAGERALFFPSAHKEAEIPARSRHGDASGPSERSTAIPLQARPLPRPLDALIGRENDIESIVSLIGSERVRLVTLTGPGGVGKTRLCLAVAAQLQSRFGEGAAFVDLAPLSEPSLVAAAISATIGLSAGNAGHEHGGAVRLVRRPAGGDAGAVVDTNARNNGPGGMPGPLSFPRRTPMLGPRPHRPISRALVSVRRTTRRLCSWTISTSMPSSNASAPTPAAVRS